MIRILFAALIILWAGATLLLSQLPWFRVPPLVERLRPYTPGGMRNRQRIGLMSAASLREVIGPLAASLGDRLAKMVGVNDDLESRLLRSSMDIDVNGFRLRQAAWAFGSTMLAALISVAASLPGPVATAMVIGAPILAFLVLEQKVSAASQDWQNRVLLELPVLIEQLGTLLSSGFSLGGALNRLGSRGRGVCAAELRTVTTRIGQGLTEIDALREWAVRSDVTAVDRLVSVLALNWEASDLGALISAEARSVRREVQRAELITIEKRSQQVWIPVTVATLLPGVIFMAVPFVDAMSRLTGR